MKTFEVLTMLNLAGLRPPGTLTLAITGACNLECAHCWVRAGEATSHAHVPMQTLCRLAEEFAAIGGEGIRITGGEPLCHPHWLDILQHSCSLGFKEVILQTNAMLINNEHLVALRKLDFPGLSIQVSMDGVTEQTHDLVRGKDTYNEALFGIMKLVHGGLARRVSIFFTEMRHNLHEIPRLLDFADKIGINSVTTGAMVLCGRASESLLLSPPDPEQYLSLLERYDSDFQFRELYKKIGSVSALEWRAGDTVRQDCCSFIHNPYLTPSGRLYPCLLCHTDEYSVTGVFEKGLADAFAEGIPIWSSLHSISRKRSEALPECLDCPGKSFCAGGCMGRAWGSCGELLATDDRCAARRAIYQQTLTTSLPAI
jgi:radical SAM protein with 4Fe4S-binding SPASM domain